MKDKPIDSIGYVIDLLSGRELFSLRPLTPKFAHFLHGGDYNPDQWLDEPDILKKDIELMKEAHINCVSVGIFSWAALEPSEGEYHLDWLAEIVDNLYRNDIYTVLATPSGAKPVWMSEKYPEIRRVANTLVRNETGERHNHCYTSPIYREKVRAIDTALAKRLANHPGVILWHLSNEFGGTCYCPLCQDAFRTWLKKKYGTLDQLNHQWWTSFWSHTYTDWEQIHPPVPNGENSTHGLTLDWKRFTTDQVIDFMKVEREAVKAVNPEIPVTTNFMYYYDEYNYAKFKDELDVISWDSYPQWTAGNNADEAARVALWHDRMRCLKGQPFLLMESTPSVTNWTPVSRLKRPGMHRTASMQAVAHGSNSVQYFQFRKSRGSMEKFHGAVVDHRGTDETREYRDVQEVGVLLENMEPLYPSEVRAKVALVYDTENRWAIEGAAGPRNCGIHYLETVQAHYQALWKMGVPMDVIDEESDLSGYQLVIAPMLYLLREGFEKKLAAFVEKGGTLVGTYLTGLVNENDLVYLGGWPGGGLTEVFGLWNEATDGLWNGETNTIRIDWNADSVAPNADPMDPNVDPTAPNADPMDGQSYSVKELCALVHLQGAKALGVYGEDFYAGEPALTVNAFGKGRAYYIGASAEAAFYPNLYRRIVSQCGIEPALALLQLPDGVEACVRTDGDTRYVFVQNFSGQKQELSLPAGYTFFTTGEAATAHRLAEYDCVILREQR